MASIKKVETLLAKVRAGVRIKDSEWPAWMRGVKSPASWSFADDRSGTVTAYLAAMGFSDESQANPAAIDWDAYRAVERGERCESCGRPGPTVCRDCGAMLDGVRRFRADGSKRREVA